MKYEKYGTLTVYLSVQIINVCFLLPNQDLELVAQKREIVQNKPKKVNIGPTCPVCDLTFTKSQNRDHVAWHFMDEFREFVAQTGNERACQLCYYTTEKPDNLVRQTLILFRFIYRIPEIN